MNDRDPIQKLRGFLALAIIWHHLGGMPLKVFGNDMAFMFWMPGRVIVWLFYVISGYSIYCGYRNQKYKFGLKDSLRFYFNRAIRILPLFYLSVILTWISLLYASPQDVPTWQSIIRTTLFLDLNFNQGIFTFTPAWFIGVIVHFYLLAPILVMGYIKMRGRMGLIATFFSLIILSVLCHRLGKVLAGSVDIRNFLGNLSLFLFGFFAYDLYNDNYSLKEKAKKILLSMITWIFLLCLFEWLCFIYHRRSVDFWSSSFFEGLVGLLGAALIVVLLFHKTTDIRNKNLMVNGFDVIMNKAGEFSYGLYLWHGLVMILILKTGMIFKFPPYAKASTFLSVYLLIVVISFCVSFIFHYIIEKPYRSLYKFGKKEQILIL